MLADVCFLILQHHFAISPCQSIATNLWLLRTPICRAAWRLRAPVKQREHGPRLPILKSPNLFCFNSSHVPTIWGSGVQCHWGIWANSWETEWQCWSVGRARWVCKGRAVSVDGDMFHCGLSPARSQALAPLSLAPDLHPWEQRSRVGPWPCSQCETEEQLPLNALNK